MNLVFELVSGFRAADVIGHTPCHPPMFGSLSIMPSAFLKAFALELRRDCAFSSPRAHNTQSHQHHMETVESCARGNECMRLSSRFASDSAVAGG